MFHPYQCLQICGNVLIAARTSRLDSFDIENGLHLSSWQSPKSLHTRNNGNGLITEENFKREVTSCHDSPTDFGPDVGPPPKRRRLSDLDDGKFQSDGIYQSPDNERDVFNAKNSQALTLIAMAATKDGHHVIGVTGEDKSIRVFGHDGRGQLKQLSQRVMPKRPCAITITADGCTIICADKFGDVYSLPLYAPVALAEANMEETTFKQALLVPGPPKPFVPAANDLTVHSLRNRKALQNQIRQRQNISEKSQNIFKHSLLLGHVSMLTDIALIDHEDRSFIITADRDEHIRVSRGIPQAHVIHGYCLGHKTFVSRLCFPKANPNLLVSGGGDDEVYIWNWLEGKIVRTASLRGHVERVMSEQAQGQHATVASKYEDDTSSGLLAIAVSNIHCLSGGSGQLSDFIAITCEAIPALFLFKLSAEGVLDHHQTLRLEGNPLSIVVDSVKNILVASIDCVHKPGTTSHLRTNLDEAVGPLVMFHNTGSEWVSGPVRFDTGSHTILASVEGKADSLGLLSNVLYGLETLRKRGGEE